MEEDKRACEKCKQFVTRDSRGVVLRGCQKWECEFDPKEKNDEIDKRKLKRTET